MTTERRLRIERLLQEALELPTAKREAFLSQACGDDVAVRKEVESLAYSDEKSSPLTEQLHPRDLRTDQPTARGFTSTISQDRARVGADEQPSTIRDTRNESLETGNVLAERYRVVNLLGRGGMGEIYLAEDLKLGQSVALKFLPRAMQHDEARLSRLLDELKIARKISHPNVCRVYDLSEAEDRPFISMEYIDGEDLARLLRRIGRLPKDKAIEVGQQLCHGLAAAHQQGVLHRDLKPANLMIDGRGQVRITDFGIAVLTDSLTGKETRCGTPAYMSPEQLAGQEVSTRSDLYAVGLVLYELFTGQAVLQAKSVAEAIELQHATLIPPSDLLKGLDPIIENVILHCLERQPNNRPTSAEAVASALTIHKGSSKWRPAPDLTIPFRPSWVLEKKLGKGGFGEVWLARHRKTRDRRSFKFCYEADRLRALQREITVFRLLKEELGNREDIHRILDWNFEHSPFFIESEYTKSGNLVEWAEEQGGIEKVPMAVRLEIVAQVATALAAAHSVGVLHKDVKPTNLLITYDADGQVKTQLTDFGLGAITDRGQLIQAGITILGLTESTEELLAGTPLYMAPELLEGRPATLQADIYALGLLLYQMVVGDFSRAMGSGWRRDVADELLVGDIAAAVDGSPERRLGNALRLAERLRTLDNRRQEYEAARQREEEKAKLRTALERARKRRRVWTAVILLLALFCSVMALMMFRIRSEADRAEQVAEFLAELFEFTDPYSTTDPGAARGTAMTVRELIDRGRDKLEGSLEDDPRTRGRLMGTLGVIYKNLGHYPEAEILLKEALSLRRRAYGKEHPEIAESLNNLAILLKVKGDYEEAEPLYREALTMRQQLLGEEHPDVAEGLNNLALLLHAKGDHEGAEPLYREALEMRRRLLGEEHPDFAEGLNNLALLLQIKGDYEGAEPLYREALTIYRRLLGDEHPDIAESLTNLALSLRSKGDNEGAERLCREALEMRRRLLGDEHPDVATSVNNLAGLLKAKGDYEAAEPLYREALTIYRRLLGDEHPHVAISVANLASLLQSKGDYKGAEPLYREALEMMRRLLGDEHPFVATSVGNLASLLQNKGDYERAESLYREALEMKQRLLGDKHPDVATTLKNLASLLVAVSRPVKAEPLIEEALEILRKTLPPDHWRILNAESVSGSVLAALRRYEEAEPLLVTSYAVIRDRKGENSDYAREARERLVVLYSAWGKLEKAAEYRALRTGAEASGSP